MIITRGFFKINHFKKKYHDNKTIHKKSKQYKKVCS